MPLHICSSLFNQLHYHLVATAPTLVLNTTLSLPLDQSLTPPLTPSALFGKSFLVLLTFHNKYKRKGNTGYMLPSLVKKSSGHYLHIPEPKNTLAGWSPPFLNHGKPDIKNEQKFHFKVLFRQDP